MKKIYLFSILLIIVVALFVNTKNNKQNIIFDNSVIYNYEVDEKIVNGTIDNSNMDFVECGNVSVRLDKLKISEINTELILSFKQNGNQNIKYNCAIFDNKGNIYSFWCPSAYENKMNNLSEEINHFCQKHNIIYDHTWGNLKAAENREDDFTILSGENNIITTRLISYSDVGFGNSKNPYLKMNQKMGNVCYIEVWNLNDNKPFIIQLNLPKNFYKNSQVEYKQVKNYSDFKLKKAVCDDTSFLLVTEIAGFNNMMNKFITTDDGKTDIEKINKWTYEEIDKYIYLSDENGNNYYCLKKSMSNVPIGNLDRVTLMFDLNMNNVTEKMFIHTITDGNNKTIEISK